MHDMGEDALLRSFGGMEMLQLHWNSLCLDWTDLNEENHPRK
jgi:hypothetical protein